MPRYDPVELGILWDRLVSIADEVVSALVTTSFSTMVRESGDLSCVLFEGGGSSLAQGTLSVPSFTGTAPPTLRHMLRRFPPEALEPGDVLITNDPWMGTGHVYDANVMRPIFRRDRLVGYSISITHLPDIGGPGYSTVVREVHEEGLWLPITKLMKAGRLNEELIEIVRANVRLEDMVVGDLMASVTCNEVAGRLLLELMDEYGLEDLAELSGAIIGATEQAMRARLRTIPDGTYCNRIRIEGVDEPITLACAVTVEGDRVHVDFDGTGRAVGRGINVPLCYTRAYSYFCFKTIVAPNMPNNQAILDFVSVAAPENCILNAQRPYATGGRHILGHYVAPLVFGALAGAVPARVQADSGMICQVNFRGRSPVGRSFSYILFTAGGYGAFADMDGRAALPGPSNMIGIPIEIWEENTGVSVLRKEILPDSGGAGEHQGGAGQLIELRNDTGRPLDATFFGSRTSLPARGFNGGRDGAVRTLFVDGKPVTPKARLDLAPGAVVSLHEAGGGGFGPPEKRPARHIRADLEAGLIGKDYVRQWYLQQSALLFDGDRVPNPSSGTAPNP
jgi:N-methylhydantoinase B